MLTKQLLSCRYETFNAVCQELRSWGRPVRIVETGCVRLIDNWVGDGQSTRIWDWLTGEIGGGVISIDIDPAAIETAQKVVSDRVTLVCTDGVPGVWQAGDIDLLYVDSHNTEAHVDHLMELCAGMFRMKQGSIILVDDTYKTLAGEWRGKGALMAQFAERVHLPILMQGEVQIAWKL